MEAYKCAEACGMQLRLEEKKNKRKIKVEIM